MRQGVDSGRPLLDNNTQDSLMGAANNNRNQSNVFDNNNNSFRSDNNDNNNNASYNPNLTNSNDFDFKKKGSISRSRKSSRKSSSAGGGGHGGKMGAWALLKSYMADPAKRPAVFVLFVCLITFMFNQVDRYLISILASDMQKDQGWGPSSHNGTGSQYNLLAGPVFQAVYLPAAIPVAWLADRYRNRRSLYLAIALLVWSLMCVASGFSNNYYQLVIFRFCLAFAESACTPLAGSLISDYYPKETRATALGIYNWGIYMGWSLALGAANVMTEYLSWRTVWWAFGFAGIVWVPFVLGIKSNTGVRKVSRIEHERNKNNRISINGSHSDNNSEINIMNNNNNEDDRNSGWKILVYFVTTPSIILLFIASLIRNAGGFVWAYNAAQFFENVKHQSNVEVAAFMQWIPLIGGSLGAVLGGYISDRLVRNAPSWRRILVLLTSNLLAAPFAFLALLLPAPYGYLCLIPSNVIGEMWIGITLALVIEVSPQKLKTTAVSIYFFFIGIAGFFPYLVTPVQNIVDSYEVALMILFPGLYVLSSVLFLLTLFTIQRDERKAAMESQIQPLPM